MDIDLLRSFVAFADCGSFTRAARQVHRTQSAFSMQMKRLESALNKSLFIKDGRKLALSDDGKQFIAYARRIVSLHDEAISQFQSDAETPPLRIGCPDDYGQNLLPDLLALIKQKYPALRLRITCDASVRLRQKLDQGELDLAILTQAADSEEGYLLRQDRGVWMASTGFLQQHDQSTPLPLALYEADCKFHSAAIHGLEKAGLPYEVSYTCPNASVLIALSRRDRAISAVASSTVPDDLNILNGELTLPELPAISIVLLPAPNSHPLVTPSNIKALAQTFFSTHPGETGH